MQRRHWHDHIKIDFYVPVEPELRAMLRDRVSLPFDEMRRAHYVTATAVVIAKPRAFANSEKSHRFWF